MSCDVSMQANSANVMVVRQFVAFFGWFQFTWTQFADQMRAPRQFWIFNSNAKSTFPMPKKIDVTCDSQHSATEEVFIRTYRIDFFVTTLFNGSQRLEREYQWRCVCALRNNRFVRIRCNSMRPIKWITKNWFVLCMFHWPIDWPRTASSTHHTHHRSGNRIIEYRNCV